MYNKLFKDCIYEYVDLPSLCVAIIDTPEFQRLRSLKQLGPAYLVYPSASHCRFEHSIGVCHLAGQFARNLRDKQPELKITDADILCVEIAGLCHDIGHGPYSHLFEEFVRLEGYSFDHAKCSTMMFDHLISQNNLIVKFEENGLGSEDIEFIKMLINPPCDHNYAIRTDKSFLYQIVANETNGIDVDKLDYLNRDSFHLNLPFNVPSLRLINNARVLIVPDSGTKMICYRNKAFIDVATVFNHRIQMHRIVYKHQVVKIINQMLLDALKEINKIFLFKCKDGKYRRITDSLNDMVAFSTMTDEIFSFYSFNYVRSMNADDHSHESSSHLKVINILERIQRRNLYKVVATVQVTGTLKTLDYQNELYSDFERYIYEHLQLSADFEHVVELYKNDLIIFSIYAFDFGIYSNPFESVYFFSKQDSVPYKAGYEAHKVLPDCITERRLSVMLKISNSDSKQSVKKVFNIYVNESWEKCKFKLESLINLF